MWKRDDANAGPCHFHRGWGEGWGLLRAGDSPREQVRTVVLLDETGLQGKLVALGRARPNDCHWPWKVDGAVRGDAGCSGQGLEKVLLRGTGCCLRTAL